MGKVNYFADPLYWDYIFVLRMEIVWDINLKFGMPKAAGIVWKIMRMHLFFARLFVSGRKQIAMKADGKLHTQFSYCLFATRRSEMRIFMREKIVLIDGHSILNRAFYGVPDLSNSQGLHTNAVFGFLNIMFKILEEEKPDYLMVAFDVK